MKFYHRDMELYVPGNVYYPREDSLLMAKAIEKLDISSRKCLDLGCGSGFLAIIMAKKGAAVTAADMSTDAVEAAERNAMSCNAEIKFFCSDLFEKIRGKFDLIVFNPPYLPVDDKYADESFAGGKTGREVIERFFTQAKNHLNENGKMLLLISSLTGEKEVVDFANKCGFKTEIIAREKLDWEEIIVIGLS